MIFLESGKWFISKNSKYFSVQCFHNDWIYLRGCWIVNKGQPALGSPNLYYSSLPLESVVHNISYQCTLLWFHGAVTSVCLLLGFWKSWVVPYERSHHLSLLPSLCHYFHAGHSQWPEDRGLTPKFLVICMWFSNFENISKIKNTESYVTVPFCLPVLKPLSDGSCGISVWAWQLVLLNSIIMNHKNVSTCMGSGHCQISIESYYPNGIKSC